jgi:hypothetical protein
MTQINFAGMTWDVRQGFGNPRNNNWADDLQSVFTDANGWLHMKIRNIDGTWYSSEVISTSNFGYGQYLFFVDGKIDDYDPNITIGLFSYTDDTNEIDIEIANFDTINASKKTVYHTVQGGVNSEHIQLNLNDTYTSHKFIWASDNITFQSYHGHYPCLPSSDLLIKDTSFRVNNIPQVGNAKLHINFWLLDALNGPINRQEAEIVIRNVVFIEGNWTATS